MNLRIPGPSDHIAADAAVEPAVPKTLMFLKNSAVELFTGVPPLSSSDFSEQLASFNEARHECTRRYFA